MKSFYNLILAFFHNFLIVKLQKSFEMFHIFLICVTEANIVTEIIVDYCCLFSLKKLVCVYKDISLHWITRINNM